MGYVKICGAPTRGMGPPACASLFGVHKNYPKSLINVERQLMVNKLKKRYDVVVFNPDGSIYLLIECKAPKVNITQDTFDQIARYNYELRAEFLMVTNGQDHYYCEMDHENEKYRFLKDIPDFSR